MQHHPDKKITILVVDDSVELLEVFRIVFEKQGYNIIAATSAKDVFACVNNNDIDILLLDVFLNGVNGRDICYRLKADEQRSFPVVLMSATPENLLDISECGADAYIEKPFDINYITEKISALVSRFPQQHALTA
ncbi:response regulator transcription factor [Ferruginibacter sp.]